MCWPNGLRKRVSSKLILPVCGAVICDFSLLILFPETEKYAHVTFFFNGGVEKQFEQEDRELIPSPKVATYDKQPEMSAQGVADKVAETVAGGKYDFVMCNFAPPDMVSCSLSIRSRLSDHQVGHTGVYDAAVQAITATDKAVKVGIS